MGKLKDEIMKLSKAEQYEIYEAIESRLFGEKNETLNWPSLTRGKQHLSAPIN